MKHQQQNGQAILRDQKRGAFSVNFIAGGIAGTIGAIATCPLDVVQTRLQSSKFDFKNSESPKNSMRSGSITGAHSRSLLGRQVFLYIRYIAKTEGFTALYKGLVPNLIGIAPSRAPYFAVYSKSKHFASSSFMSQYSSLVHVMSALSASLTVSTATNPIWFLKTRLQLDSSDCGRRRALRNVIEETLRKDGIAGFYRGLTASYAGSLETVTYFVIYEKLKQLMTSDEDSLHSGHYVCAAFVAKTVATVSFYPHEVVRTRLRQERGISSGKRYHGFFQTLFKVGIEEGYVGLYGGMGAHVMRQVPNTVIMFLLYELIIDSMTKE